MKHYKLIFAFLYIAFTCSCVQESHLRTVVFQLDVKGIKNIKTVGLRGENPLNWNSDYEMVIGKDSIYSATISGETGYLFTNVKFTINGEFELVDKPNRKVYFDTKKDTTFYKAIFNVAKEEN
jgi:putative oxidoreductase